MEPEDLLDTAAVLAKLHCSKRHLQAIIGNGFPQPLSIAGANYWLPSDLAWYLQGLSRGAFTGLEAHKRRPSGERT